jgi:hypothetical protein
MKTGNLILRSGTLVVFTGLLLLFSGCESPEGYGGSSSISGKIITEYYNDDYSLYIREEASVDEEVFLLFGDNDNVGDRVNTSMSGTFEFPYLRPGNYTVYFRSEDSTTLDRDQVPVSFDVELKAGEDVDLGDLKEFKTLDFDDGTAKIYGVIMLINYKNSSEYPFLEIKDTSLAQEHEVYLTYGTHAFDYERVRTDYKGYFEFRDLIPGDYEIVTYSEDVAGGTEDIPMIEKVTITELDQEVDLGVICIEQL